jgi:hypothetical protein
MATCSHRPSSANLTTPCVKRVPVRPKYSCSTLVVFEQAAESLTTLNRAALRISFFVHIREEQPVAFPPAVSTDEIETRTMNGSLEGADSCHWMMLLSDEIERLQRSRNR